jgi:superfamily I DNA/RNA helicase
MLPDDFVPSSRHVLIEGAHASGKSRQLERFALQALQSVPSHQCLFLVVNGYQQQALKNRLLNALTQPLGYIPVYTFSGWVRNCLFSLWSLVEQRLQQQPAHKALVQWQPNLCGFETTEYLTQLVLQQNLQQNPERFTALGISMQAFTRQLIRRGRLRAENRLNRDAVTQRDEHLALEAFDWLPALEKQIDTLAYRARSLDAGKQLEVFWGLLEQSPEAADWMRQRCQVLMAEDVDEWTPAAQAFLHWALPHTKQVVFTGNSQGGARQGYSGAYPQGWAELKQAVETSQNQDVTLPHGGRRNPTPAKRKTLCRGGLHPPANRFYLRSTKKQTEAGLLAITCHWPQEKNWLKADWQAFQANWMTPDEMPMLPLQSGWLIREAEAPNWVSLLDNALLALQHRLAEGAALNSIGWVLPSADSLTLEAVQVRLQQAGLPYQLLHGTQKPADTALCRTLLYGLLLLNSPDAPMNPLSGLEWRFLLQQTLLPQLLKTETESSSELWVGLSQLAQSLAKQGASAWGHSSLGELALKVQQEEGHENLNEPEASHAWLPAYEQAPASDISPALLAAYQQLRLHLLNLLPLPHLKQAYALYERWLRPTLNPASREGDLLQTLLSGLQEQELLSPPLRLKQPDALRLWLRKALAGVVANTPAMPPKINPNALLIATPQKWLDVALPKAELWWLDAQSHDWCRSDEAPFYNAWLASPAFNVRDNALPEEGENPSLNSQLRVGDDARTRKRAATLLGKLALLAQQHNRLFASALDKEGRPQPARLWLRCPTPASPAALLRPKSGFNKNFTPRTDQAPVLAYTQGTMAVAATPGAGKTFINVALILTLVEKGVQAENILVLTYMESAAKTLQTRLQEALGDGAALPCVTTIHGLAFRLLRQEDAAARLGLVAPQWQLADEALSEQCLREAANLTLNLASSLEPNLDLQSWAQTLNRAMGHAKSCHVSLENLLALLNQTTEPHPLQQALALGWQTYQNLLQQRDALDFTDLILKAIELLEADANFLAKVQAQYHIVLEDEAQDSSPLLQHLLGLLCGEKPNLIRTGDLNQSITTTFSAASPEVFGQFIANAETVVKMTQSGRCCAEVIALANRWLFEAPNHAPDLQQAFIPLELKAIEGVNPTAWLAPQATAYDTQSEEEEALVEQITRLGQTYAGASLAVLVRYNKDVLRLSGLLQKAGVAAIAHTDRMEKNPVFEVLWAYLECLAYPLEAAKRLRLLDLLVQHQCEGFTEVSEATLGDAKALLGASPIFLEPVGQVAHLEVLVQLYYDWLDFSRDALGTHLDGLLVRMSERLFRGVVERSNGYLCALLAQNTLQRQQADWNPFSNTQLNGALSQTLDNAKAPIELVLEHFRLAARKGMKPLTAQALGLPTVVQAVAGNKAGSPKPDEAIIFVQVMTLHKAKGQEFDLVWMPSLQESQFPHEAKQIKARLEDRLVVWLNRNLPALAQNTNPAEKPATTELLARSTVEEEARLVYVGLTRAKRGVLLSCYKAKTLPNGKVRPQKPALAFNLLNAWAHPAEG